MENFFPADVSLRVSGEIADAQPLFGKARQLLFRALKMKETGSPLVRLFLPGTDGSLIHVYVKGALKHVYVQPGPRQPVEIEEVEEAVLPLITLACADMLSGVVSPGEPAADGSAHEFHPTASVADLYQLDFGWQDVDRLGVEADPAVSALASTHPLQVHWPKPSMYSGAMQRVVQAVYGIGKTSVASDEGATEIAFDAVNHYQCRWDVTDGIHRVDDDFWVVRIDKEEGVLAMPLPLFECTRSEAYRDALADIGDVDTYAIVAEFGGLPTGEGFPENHPDDEPPTFDRDDALANGTLLRIMAKEDLAPFFRNAERGKTKLALYAYCCWAFSASGRAFSAHNTCFWYSNEAAATALITNWLTDGFDALPLEERMLRAEHWKVSFTLSAIERTPLPGVPVGEGTAILAMVEESLMIGEPFYVNAFRFDLGFFKVPTFTGEENLTTLEFWGRTSTALHELDWPIVHNALLDISCPVTVFYIGEDLEVVRHQPPKEYEGDIYRGPYVELSSSIAYGSIDVTAYGFSYVVKQPELCDVQRFDVGFGAAGRFDGFFLDVGERWETQDGFCVHVENLLNSGIQSQHHPGPPTVSVNGAPISIYEYFDVSGPLISEGEGEYGFTDHLLGGPTLISATYTISYRGGRKRSGRFYSTSLDVREERRFRSVKAGGDVPSVINYADAWESEVGLVIPPMCREGYVFVRYFGGRTDPLGPSALLPAGVEQIGIVPGLGAGVVPLQTLGADQVNFGGSPGVRWRSLWTSMLNYQYRLGASINAGPTKCGVISDGVSRLAFGNDDVLSSGAFFGVPIPIPPLPMTYLGSAGDIDVTGKSAIDTTFVGAV